MAMVVKNNMSAVNTLNKLNQNSSELAKSLKKISTGTRITGAGDDASAYSISERMQVRIRGLNQCDTNTKTGNNLLTLAERAVNEQVQVAQRLKEIALKATDDTYSDVDRKVLQSETTHMLMQLNAVAYETNYNGIQLLARRDYGRTTTYFDAGAPPKMNNPGINVVPAPNGVVSLLGIPGYGPTTPPSNNKEEYKIDLSGLSGLNLPNDLDGQGFSIMCTACGQFNSIKFDANMPAGTAQYYSSGQPDAYVIGIQGLTSTSSIEDAIFDGIQNVKGGSATSYGIGNHNTTIEKRTDGYYITRDVYVDPATGVLSPWDSQFVLYNGFKGELVTTQGYLPQGEFYIQGDTKSSQETRLYLPNTTLNILFPDANSDWDIVPTDDDYPKAWPGGFLEPGSIEFKYYDEKYNLNGNLEDIRRAKWYDEVWPYPRKDAKATASCVLTRQDANKFLKDIDQAIKYLLHCSTTLGAQSQRLSAMNDNIITGNENTQASESTIRDADMAKEMVTYTKHNVLTQTAQSMLSQANQNSSGVLDILQ